MCDLDNKEEFQNMLLLAKSMGVQHVEVVVELKSDIGQSSSSGSLRVGVEKEIDALRRFCHHKENVLLSAPWENGIAHAGQRFVGGAQEFHDVLCKYVFQCGFQFKYVKNETIRVTAVCGTDVQTSKNPRVSSDLVSSTISEIMKDKPLTRPCDVVTILKRDYGLDLRWYSDVVMRYNPGSYVNIDYDASSQQFCRFSVSFAACISGFNSCRPLLFLDGTFLKRKYKGQLLAATAKDENNSCCVVGLFPFAFAIVDSETTANWSWFLHELGKVVDGKCQITFISDRNLSLLEAMPKVFPSAHHSYCLQHLKSNLRDRIKGINNGFRDHLISSLGDCAYEPTVSKLKEEEWGMRYGKMTSNAAESFNNWIKEAHNLPITQIVDTIRTQLMRQMYARRDHANKWNELICPTFKTMLMDSFNDNRSWQVSKANEDVFEVHSIPSVTVDIGRQTYRAAYSGVIPVPSVEKPPFDHTDFIIYPPTVKRSPRRPKKNRIPSRGEKLKQIRCGSYDKLGSL
ncbi:uncharacterized protein LOC114274911 [Camellia sinensis]|uniref:uncharacterized protein LOC114274911 n=1 Tax=Camellia sinensis TaxID=4442 RepID=UPI0010369570|nr:uncharacterized protein LOC114274911 [Camellia sinensis]